MSGLSLLWFICGSVGALILLVLCVLAILSFAAWAWERLLEAIWDAAFERNHRIISAAREEARTIQQQATKAPQ